MVEFTEKVVGTVVIEKPVTEKDIETIMVGAIEGGIGYWARLENVGEDWERRPEGTPASIWATQLLLDGKEVVFAEEHDNDKLNSLTLEKLISGIEQNAVDRPFDSDLENGDSQTCDCIVQYALFNELVYG